MKLPFKIVWNNPEDEDDVRREEAQERRLHALEKKVRDLEKAAFVWRPVSATGARQDHTYPVSDVVKRLLHHLKLDLRTIPGVAQHTALISTEATPSADSKG